MDDLFYMKDLTDNERLLFQTEYGYKRKNPTTGILFALFLGGVGAHQFYMGHIFLGVVYLIFCFTLIPVIIALIECFLMSGRVKKYNSEAMKQIAIKIKALRPEPSIVAA